MKNVSKLIRKQIIYGLKKTFLLEFIMLFFDPFLNLDHITQRNTYKLVLKDMSNVKMNFLIVSM